MWCASSRAPRAANSRSGASRRCEDVPLRGDLRLDAGVQPVELGAVAPPLGPVAEAGDVRRRGRRQLEARRALDEGDELLRQVAAARDELDETLAPQLLHRRPDARAPPAAARLDAELVQVLARPRREVAGGAGERLAVQLPVAQQHEADAVR